jgi:hypothetical protein
VARTLHSDTSDKSNNAGINQCRGFDMWIHRT